MLTPRLCNRGYLRVAMSRGGKRVDRLVHQMVAEAFLGPRPDGLQVNHISGHKAENGVENLEYVTPSQNIRHAYGAGLRTPLPAKTPKQRRWRFAVPWTQGESHGLATITEKDVKEIRRLYADGVRNVQIAAILGISKNVVSDVACGRSWKHV
jgi:hypothetical protein